MTRRRASHCEGERRLRMAPRQLRARAVRRTREWARSRRARAADERRLSASGGLRHLRSRARSFAVARRAPRTRAARATHRRDRARRWRSARHGPGARARGLAKGPRP
jgi:hypothetical protein